MPLPEGFDPATLIKPADENDSDFEMGDPEEYEAARERAEKGEPEPDDEGDDDAETQAELDAKIAAGVKKALEEAEKDDEDDDEAEPEDEYLTPDQKRIKELEKELETRKQSEKEAEVDHEVRSAIGKLRMTDKQVANTVRYFDVNQDLEGVVSFEKAALRANPELNDRPKPTPRAGNKSDEAGETAEVITRGAGGPGAPVAFKPVPGRGSYAAVTQAIRSSSAVRTLIRNE